MKYDIYQAEDGHKKKYLVFEKGEWMHDIYYGDAMKTACKFFKCSKWHMHVSEVWVNGVDMYFENPFVKGFHKNYAFSYHSTRRTK